MYYELFKFAMVHTTLIVLVAEKNMLICIPARHQGDQNGLKFLKFPDRALIMHKFMGGCHWEHFWHDSVCSVRL